MKMLLKTIAECYGAMEKISRVILRAALAAVSLVYLAAILLLWRYEGFFPDYDTALCAVGTLLECAKELSGAMIVPVMLYETLGRAILFRPK